MPALADDFGHIWLSALVARIPVILLPCTPKEMSRIDATSVVTMVAGIQTGRVLSGCSYQHQSMRTLTNPFAVQFYPDTPISVWTAIVAPSPVPAVGILDEFPLKNLRNFHVLSLGRY
jgi:hypothetical protein